jgi:hypothetical protein
LVEDVLIPESSVVSAELLVSDVKSINLDSAGYLIE